MKKLICAILLVAALATLLAACGSETFTCDLCEKEKTGKKHTKEFMGEEVTYCDDCVKEMAEAGAEIGEELGELEDELGDLKDDLGDLFG
ncbi:MAG: hypothetical protein E7599_08065 [Ruminococcaceae bacterium]|nr:hypothetical protein [Oscillospiraceae bacterium]